MYKFTWLLGVIRFDTTHVGGLFRHENLHEFHQAVFKLGRGLWVTFFFLNMKLTLCITIKKDIIQRFIVITVKRTIRILFLIKPHL